MRLVAPLVKNMPVDQALTRLQFTSKDAARPIIDVLKTARADAIHNHKLEEKNLIVRDVEISEGPIYRRTKPASRGKIHSLAKRTSHLKVVLEG
jgi:large subunit ribosomal protein L22